MAIKYIPYFKEPIEGQAILDNFVRTNRMLKYADNSKVFENIKRGLPLYEMEEVEQVGDNEENLLIRGECVSACAYLKEKDIKVDLVYIDPPYASGADYAKTVYIRRNPKLADALAKAEETLDIEELKFFEEKMYGDVWNKEAYLNWMYENLSAIKSIMSDNGSIYVHLDWHIGHYVKVLLDEIFGENCYKNEIIWKYFGPTSSKNNYPRKHDTIYYYSLSNTSYFDFDACLVDYDEKAIKRYDKLDADGRRYKIYNEKDGTQRKAYMNEGTPTDVFEIPGVQNPEYATEKPSELLSRIIKASSTEEMVVADFFGGSGVTAKVSNEMNRKFIHCDVGVNSIETTRDRLISVNASFKILDIKDGVNLYRNPIQTMDKINSLIPGLKNEDSVGEFWEGAINDTKDGLIPVYIPNLMDSTNKLLDIPLMNKVINLAIPELPDNIKKVIVYYIDIIDEKEIKLFIKEYLKRDIEIELRDLKNILDETVINDIVDYKIDKNKVSINNFISDRLIKKINEYNDKMNSQSLISGKKANLIEISKEGLELIEFISLDCTSQDGIWHSDEEIKIDKKGYVMNKGQKTYNFWNGTIEFTKMPLRMKIRNISGDELIIKF